MDSSSSSNDDLSNVDAQQRLQLQQGLQMLQAVAEGHKQIISTTRLCFDRCISYPGKALSTSNQTCLWNCAQRYAEASFFIKERSLERLKSGELSSPSSLS